MNKMHSLMRYLPKDKIYDKYRERYNAFRDHVEMLTSNAHCKDYLDEPGECEEKVFRASIVLCELRKEEENSYIVVYPRIFYTLLTAFYIPAGLKFSVDMNCEHICTYRGIDERNITLEELLEKSHTLPELEASFQKALSEERGAPPIMQPVKVIDGIIYDRVVLFHPAIPLEYLQNSTIFLHSNKNTPLKIYAEFIYHGSYYYAAKSNNTRGKEILEKARIFRNTLETSRVPIFIADENLPDELRLL